MDRTAQTIAVSLDRPAQELTPIATWVEELSYREAVRRSEENILQWMQYLPNDCIATMIAMGWDEST